MQPVAPSRPQGVVVVTFVDVRAQHVNRAHIQLFQVCHSYTGVFSSPQARRPTKNTQPRTGVSWSENGHVGWAIKLLPHCAINLSLEGLGDSPTLSRVDWCSCREEKANSFFIELNFQQLSLAPAKVQACCSFPFLSLSVGPRSLQGRAQACVPTLFIVECLPPLQDSPRPVCIQDGMRDRSC